MKGKRKIRKRRELERGEKKKDEAASSEDMERSGKRKDIDMCEDPGSILRSKAAWNSLARRHYSKARRHFFLGRV